MIPVFFPKVIWLGLAPVLVGLTIQFIGHVIYVNIKLKSFYSPDVFATVFSHIPIGVLYIYYIQTNNLINFGGWLLAIMYMIASLFLIFYVIEQKLLGSKNPPYPFDEDEMERGGVKKRFGFVRQLKT